MLQPWCPFWPLGFGIVQGDVISQADVGAEGFPESLADERCLPCGRCFREQEGAMENGKELGQGAVSPAFATQFTVFNSLLLKKFTVALCFLSDQTRA